MIQNPVLPGYNPDPSIVRVGPDYYIATSTNGWQPGIRLFHSTDLVEWKLAGHVLQGGHHELRGLDFNGGIWAPSITYDAAAELFYVAYSLVKSTNADYFDVDNFVVTASDVNGPWSEPSYLNSIGFDPSFFHDDDGRHWVLTLEWDARDGYQHPGPIVLEEYDAGAGRLVGPSRRIYRGGTDRGCLEGAAMYKRDGYYYLMAAEGGTGFGHGVTLARSRDIAGPFEPSPVNPFITSNPAPHYGRNVHDYLRPELYNPDAELQKAGHGSLVSTPAGEWYVAHLCSRPLTPNQLSVLGRETALQQVEWTDDGWLRLTAGGVLARLQTAAPVDSDSPELEFGYRDVLDEFDGPVVDKRISTLRRTLSEDWATLGTRAGSLSVRGGDHLTSRYDVSFLATQLQDFRAVATTEVSLDPQHFSHSAGLVVFYDTDNFAYLRVYASESLGCAAIGIVLVVAGVKRELLLDRTPLNSGGTNSAQVVLQALIDDGNLQFRWRLPDEADFHAIGPAIDATFMSDESTRGFTGTMIGLASVDAYRKDLIAHFGYFHLQHGAAAATNPGQ